MRRAVVSAIAFGFLVCPALADDKAALKAAGDLTKQGRYGQAQAIYQQLVDAAGTDAARLAPLLIARAEAYFAASEYGRAEAALSAARALQLPDALQTRANTLGDKIAEKLAAQQISGSVTVSAVHDSHVRHKVRRVVGANGVEIVEICDEEPSGFGDDDYGPSFNSAENCYYEEVTDEPKAATATLNMPDWQAQTTDKVEHRLTLDANGSYWRTTGELSQGWHEEASDQNNRTVKARTGPSWFLPDWQTRIDLAAAYLTIRINHQTTLQYFAPLAVVEWRPVADLRLNASYQYEVRDASPGQQSGDASLLDTQLRWDVTANDRLTGRALLRQQATQFAYNSYKSGEGRANYRRSLPWLGIDGGFVEAEFRVRYTSYNGPGPNDGGALRRDTVPTELVILGQDFGKTWTVKASCSYTAVKSTVPRFGRNDFQYYLAVTRNF